MKTLSSSIAALAVVVGGAGATLAYQTASDAGPVQPADQRTAVAASPSATATPQVRLRPCESPAVLRRGVCVTEVTRYVTPAPAPATSSATPYDDDRYDDDRYDDDRQDAYDDDRDEREDADEDRSDHAEDHHEHGEDHEGHGEDHEDD